MSELRPNIPNDIKRRLRQEAGFGCCRCGHPFIQYHHIIPWAEDQHFRLNDMMVLCGQCHPLCTAGALTEADQRALKARPKNIVDKRVRGQLFVNSSELVVNLAGGRAIEAPRLLVLSGSTVLEANLDRELGRVLISAVIHDQAGDVVARLQDNEWSMAPESIWDFEAYPLHATIRQRSREVSFAVDAREEQIYLQGKWFHQGRKIEFTPSEGKIGLGRFSGNLVSHCGTMISVD